MDRQGWLHDVEQQLKKLKIKRTREKGKIKLPSKMDYVVSPYKTLCKNNGACSITGFRQSQRPSGSMDDNEKCNADKRW